MNYLCLVYFEQSDMDALSVSEKAALNRNSLACNDEMRTSGHYVVSRALQPVSSARTLRIRKGKLSITDGPFAETKEHLGGFVLIEARDQNEAVEVASKIPLAKLGSIEVRPVMEVKVEEPEA